MTVHSFNTLQALKVQNMILKIFAYLSEIGFFFITLVLNVPPGGNNSFYKSDLLPSKPARILHLLTFFNDCMSVKM